ncbi:putative G-protein coupled receptor 148 [Platysternon megacephalum]|uniref:Putative G-protein coupled receptor 148 n=1 Tax=Platysternon megacephalum TaxID=55544 RepID=A0A4D9ELM4_9SAUR|nr:putative G-protein coupled receptor 148 [Platysternon megacephalum]
MLLIAARLIYRAGRNPAGPLAWLLLPPIAALGFFPCRRAALRLARAERCLTAPACPAARGLGRAKGAARGGGWRWEDAAALAGPGSCSSHYARGHLASDW